MINIRFPDGNSRSYEEGVTGYQIAEGISPRLAAEVLAVEVKPLDADPTQKGEVIDLTRPLVKDCCVRLLK